MADKKYKLTFELSNKSTKSVEFTVPEGPQGEKGEPGAAGADGYTPVKGVDYNTAADQESIVQQVIAALGTPVFGTVDENNNIILTGDLASGTYTLKYEDAEGAQTEIGSLMVGSVGPSYTNVIPLSTDADGSIFNGKGWIENKRLNSSGVVADVGSYGYTGVTGFIPITDGDILRTSATMISQGGSTQQGVGFYDANKAFITRLLYYHERGDFAYDLFTVYSDYSLTYKHDASYSEVKNAAFVRFCFTGITDGAVITKNEEIV